MSLGLVPKLQRCCFSKHFQITHCNATAFAVNHRTTYFHGFRQTRSFLSQSFQCKEVWDERSKASVFNLEMNKFFFELERKFQRDGKFSPIDVDIFANALLKPDGNKNVLKAERIRDRMDQMEEILQRFRRTPETNFMLASTPHAVIRCYLDGGGGDSLLKMLDDRHKFGLFPDDYSLVYMLNHFLTDSAGSNWRDGSKVAAMMMLQEEYDIPIACEMGVYAAFHYTETEAFRDMDEIAANWNPIKDEVPPEPEEEVKVPVWFVDNNYFDDHFDLTKRQHLIGKSLAKFAQCTTRHFLNNDTNEHSRVVKNSLELFGWVLFEKWENVLKRAKQLDEENAAVVKNCLESMIFSCKANDGGEIQESALNIIKKLKTVEIDISNYLKEQVEASVVENENEYITMQSGIYRGWNEQRQQELMKDMESFKLNERRKHLEQKKQELAKQEEKLFFFDNYERMEEEKQTKFREWRKTWPHKSGIKMNPEHLSWNYKPGTEKVEEWSKTAVRKK